VVKDLVETSLPLFKFGGGLAEILYLFLLLAALVLVVLEFLFEEGIHAQGFLELRLQPLYHNGVTLSTPSRVDFSLAASAWQK
jgi:hypothetical protein